MFSLECLGNFLGNINSLSNAIQGLACVWRLDTAYNHRGRKHLTVCPKERVCYDGGQIPDLLSLITREPFPLSCKFQPSQLSDANKSQKRESAALYERAATLPTRPQDLILWQVKEQKFCLIAEPRDPGPWSPAYNTYS